MSALPPLRWAAAARAGAAGVHGLRAGIAAAIDAVAAGRAGDDGPLSALQISREQSLVAAQLWPSRRRCERALEADARRWFGHLRGRFVTLEIARADRGLTLAEAHELEALAVQIIHVSARVPVARALPR